MCIEYVLFDDSEVQCDRNVQDISQELSSLCFNAEDHVHGLPVYYLVYCNL